MLRSPSGEIVPRIVTSAMAHELGFTTKQIRGELAHNRWRTMARGVFLSRPDLPTRADWTLAGLAIAGRGAQVSGWDAVRAYGIGSERAPVDEVLILCPNGAHRTIGRVRLRPSTRPVQTHRRAIDGSTAWAPMAAPARAVADTALVYRFFDPVRALVTAAVQRRLCTPQDLQRELDDGPQNGSAHLRRAIEDVFGGAESISEAQLGDVLAAAGLPRPEFNVPIVTWDGHVVAVADALWRGLRAALEVDSKAHHFYEPKWTKTMRRHNRLTISRLAITHYPPADLLNEPHRVGAEIDEWLRGRADELGVAYPPPPPPSRADGRPELHVPYVLPPPPPVRDQQARNAL